MKLKELLARFDDLNEDDVIFAEKPWNLDGSAMIGHLDSDFRVPTSISSKGLDYFIGVATAKEAMEVFGDHPPTSEKRAEFIIYYAENDAFPDWVYNRN